VFAVIKTLKNKDAIHAKDDYTSLKTLHNCTSMGDAQLHLKATYCMQENFQMWQRHLRKIFSCASTLNFCK